MKMAIAAATAPISGRVNMRAVSERVGRAGSPVLGDCFVAVGVLIARPRCARPALRAGAVTWIRSQARSCDYSLGTVGPPEGERRGRSPSGERDQRVLLAV